LGKIRDYHTRVLLWIHIVCGVDFSIELNETLPGFRDFENFGKPIEIVFFVGFINNGVAKTKLHQERNEDLEKKQMYKEKSILQKYI
jgi:hypothetical protein